MGFAGPRGCRGAWLAASLLAALVLLSLGGPGPRTQTDTPRLHSSEWSATRSGDARTGATLTRADDGATVAIETAARVRLPGPAPAPRSLARSGAACSGLAGGLWGAERLGSAASPPPRRAGSWRDPGHLRVGGPQDDDPVAG